jgi:hypothetical protein
MGVVGVKSSCVSCVDLRAIGDGRYKVTLVDGAVGPKRGKRIDPWELEIICNRGRGSIIPHGGSKLNAYCRGDLAATLKALACVTVWQEGDDECTVLFDVADFQPVFELLGARRKRNLSDEAKAALVARLHRHSSVVN